MSLPRRILARLRVFFRLTRRFSLTREGRWFVVGTLLVGGASINSGFNLLFLVWGMMLGLILASGVLSDLCLQRLKVSRQPPLAVHAGAPYLMGIAVRNEKRRTSSFSIEATDLMEDRPLKKGCYFPKLPPGTLKQTAYRHAVSRRGWHRLWGFRISTRFPFGFIRKSRDIQDPLDILVYPALVPVPPSALPGSATRQGSHGARRARRGEFFGLREFRPSDDPRDIHWRTSARRGRPFVRESEDDAGRRVIILLENGAAAGGSDEAFEAAVSMAASLAVDLLEKGYEVGLGSRSASVRLASGAGHADRLLGFLALVNRVDPAMPLHDPGGVGVRLKVAPSPTAAGSPEIREVAPPPLSDKRVRPGT